MSPTPDCRPIRAALSNFMHLAMMLIALPLLIAVTWQGASAEVSYPISQGDTLKISILGYDNLSGEYVVQPDGTVGIHLLGHLDVAGKELDAVREAILQQAEQQFQTTPSILVEVAAYRDVFIVGPVQRPGAYPFRPGLTVLKALALAGGPNDGQLTGNDEEARRSLDARRRLLQAEVRLKDTERRLSALNAELASINGEESDAEVTATAENKLIGLRRLKLQRSVERSEQQSILAEAEAKSMMQRRDLMGGQIIAVEEQVERTQSLVDKGLSRRESLLDLKNEADDYRADELEAIAFEARARQTAANAKSNIEIARVEYHENLLAEQIELEVDRALARAEYRASQSFLQQVAALEASEGFTETLVPVYEIVRGTETIAADTSTLLRPDDVLQLRFEFASQPTQ